MEDQINRALKEIEALETYKGEDEVISSLDYQQLLKDKKALSHIGCAIPTLEGLLNGFQIGELVIISGTTGQGKTSFAQSLTQNFFNYEGIKSLWFSYEVRPEQFFSKFPKLPLFYLPKTLKDKSVNWLEERILEAKLKFNTQIVFVDHLHYLVDIIKTRQPSLEIGSIMRSLKTLAIRHEIIIFLIAHTTKIKFDDEPDNDSLRDSSFIAQEADIVLMLWRLQDKKTKEFTNETILKICKSRREGIISKKIKLQYLNSQFSELTNIYDEQQLS